MSTCLKTGGLIVLEDYNHALSCDLHIVRKRAREAAAIVAYTAGKPIHEWPEKLVTITVLRGADYFDRIQGADYGVIVVAPEFCRPSPGLLHYIADDPFAQIINWSRA